MKQAIMSTAEACSILGIRPARLRHLMRTKAIDIGRVVEPANGKGNSSYIIYRDKLMTEIGRIDKGEWER
nr:MAG TPA: hypothetical protein [Siphoviridae sp. ctuK76]